MEKCKLNLVSYNMHGFNQGIAFTKSLCTQYDVILLQEHWLHSKNLYLLGTLHPDFNFQAVSSMDDTTSRHILSGRPFGGVAILWRKKFNVNIKYIGSDSEGRCLSILLSTGLNRNIVITSVYFPCYDSLTNYLTSIGPVHAYIQDLLMKFQNELHIIAGDFNFECNPSQHGFNLFDSIAQNYGLHCCDSFVNGSINYTYNHSSLNHTSWIDHFFVSTEIFQSTPASVIIDVGDNISDHCPITCSLAILFNAEKCLTKDERTPILYNERWDKADLLMYYQLTGIYLQQIITPSCLLSSNLVKCTDVYDVIDQYYIQIVKALKNAAATCVPKIRCHALKAYWNAELDELKQKSIDWHIVWKECGRPRSGVINNVRLHAKYKYKQAISNAALEYEAKHCDELYEQLSKKDSTEFWKCWNAKYRKRLHAAIPIEGRVKDKEIAELFRDHIAEVSQNTDNSTTKHFQELYINYARNQANLNRYALCIDDVEAAIKTLKLNKAAGHDGLVSEHIFHSHPALVYHLKILFTAMINVGYVPEDFGKGIVIPIVKDKCGDVSRIDNYRPITLSPVITKIFERILIFLFSQYIDSDDLQFGFKRNLGCSTAIHVLKTVINYFTDNLSNVYIATLDASKAFDKLNHHKLFAMMIDKQVPITLIDIIVNWYSKLFICVRWNNIDSTLVHITSGVRQGGVLSPLLFNFYINQLILCLKQSDLGCHLSNCYVGCVLYADDIVLLSASNQMLQRMLDACIEECQRLKLTFNDKKSTYIIIGPTFNVGMNNILTICHQQMQRVEQIKYLGIHILSSRTFSVNLEIGRKKFYSAVNALYFHCKLASEPVKLNLYENYCLPLLLYGLEGISLTAQQIQCFNVCWNNVYRRIFGYRQWESVKQIMWYMGRLDFVRLYEMRRFSFIKKIVSSHNSVIQATVLHSITEADIITLELKYGISLEMSKSNIRQCFYDAFKLLL